MIKKAAAWTAEAATTVYRRLSVEAWPILQRVAAATLAWWIAQAFGDHPDPFFAPIAAIISLNQTPGQRGLNAMRLLTGVFIGIGAGELTLLVLSDTYGTLAVATLVAMAVASAGGGPRITIAQAASAAVLTVAVADGSGGLTRMIDALIGAGVALVFTQILFTPDPLRLLHRAESSALTSMSDALRRVAHALETHDKISAESATRDLRDLRDTMSTLADSRAASTRVVRRSVMWRRRQQPVVKEQENAGHLDLLAVSCLTVARMVMAHDGEDARPYAGIIERIADQLTALAENPGDTAVRQHVVSNSADILQRLAALETLERSSRDSLADMLQLLVSDVVQFAGVERT